MDLGLDIAMGMDMKIVMEEDLEMGMGLEMHPDPVIVEGFLDEWTYSK